MRVLVAGLQESARALCVLALIFLSFGHTAPQAAADQTTIATAYGALSICGDVPGDPPSHAPCHACRIGSGADLPPPCPVAAAAYGPVLAVDFVETAIAAVPAQRTALPGPRAPPAA